MAAEAEVMAYARAQGFPVPAVDEISGDGLELVMERIDGPDMVATLQRRPWTVRGHGTVLADLHRRLHEIDGPDWLRAAPAGVGGSLVHMDLHPFNVILGPQGPVVIDWTNAGRGDPAADVALTWVLLASGEVPTGRVVGALLRRIRAALVRAFLDGVDRGAARRQLRDVVAWKVLDANMSPAEQAAMWRLVEVEVEGRPV
jgi:aminoglycoside phosphotransferase (APT) family kinase protein